MNPMIRNLALLVGRVLASGVFIYDSTLIAKNFAGGAGAVTGLGLPSQAIYIVALCQFVGGIMLILGFWTRLAALAFAAFCVSTAVFFHYNPGNAGETIQAGKDLAIAGGFLALAMAGPGRWSIDKG